MNSRFFLDSDKFDPDTSLRPDMHCVLMDLCNPFCVTID